MKKHCFVQSFTDLSSELPIKELGALLSERIFAGISFVGLEEGILDEIPAMRLERDFLGLRVILGGRPGKEGGYTLEIELVDFPWSVVPENESSEVVCDISAMVKQQLKKVNKVDIIEELP
jgi:hypothetical protein